MMRISASARDLSDSHLRRITQLGVDAVDFGEARDLPGVRERGYPEHRGGYIGSGASAWRTGKRPPELTPEELESVPVDDLAGLLARVEIPEG